MLLSSFNQVNLSLREWCQKSQSYWWIWGKCPQWRCRFVTPEKKLSLTIYYIMFWDGGAELLTHLLTFALYELKLCLDIWVWKQDHQTAQWQDISFNLPFIVLARLISLVQNLHNNLAQFLVNYYYRGQAKSRLLLKWVISKDLWIISRWLECLYLW